MSHMLRMSIEDTDNSFQEHLRKFHLNVVVYLNENAVHKLSVNECAFKNTKKPNCLLTVNEQDRILLIFENTRENEINIGDIEVECKVYQLFKLQDILIMQQLNLEAPVQKWFRIQVKHTHRDFFEFVIFKLFYFYHQ